jgi:serine/threonine protein kinase/tetratricopeptide (TPR) repeat protein
MSYDYVEGDEPVPGYRVIEFLGEGGFGKVWKASAPGGTEVALKVIALGGVQGRKEFRALQLVKKVRHPNLIPVVAFWLKDENGDILDDALTVQDDLPMGDTSAPQAASETMVVAEETPAEPAELIIAMGLGGQSLFQRLEECQLRGREGIPVAELLNYMEGAAEAIDYLNRPIHDLGAGQAAIQHCDIKPQNLMVVGGATQICDFGLSRVMGAVRSTMAAAGTVAYAAPECLIDGKPSPSTDQYSLAITYFELRMGTLPYGSETFAGVTEAVIKGKLDLSKLPDTEQAVVRRATSREPQKRYSSAVVMVQALRAAVSGDQVAPAGSARRIPVFTILVTAIVLAAGGFFGVQRMIRNRAEMAQEDGGEAIEGPAAVETAPDQPPVGEVPGAGSQSDRSPIGHDDGTPGAAESTSPPQPDDSMSDELIGSLEDLLEQGRYKEVIDKATNSIADNPDDARLFRLRGKAYLKTEAWQEALDDLGDATAIEAADSDTIDRGMAYLGMEALPEASESFAEALENDPSNPDARFGMGLLHLRQGDFEEAVAVFEALMARKDAPEFVSRKEYAGAYLKRGTGFLLRGLQEKDDGQLDRAIADFIEGARHDPDDFRLHSRLAAIYNSRENWSEALDCLDKALAIEEDAIDYVNRGQAHQGLEDLDAAMKDFVRATQLAPENGNAHYFLGECYRNKNEYSDALDAYTKAIGNHAKTEDAKFNLVYAHFWRGVCALALDRLDEAAGDIGEALDRPEAEQLGDIGRILDALADAFAQQHRYAEAIRWTKRAIKAAVDPDQRAEYESQLKKYSAERPDA